MILKDIRERPDIFDVTEEGVLWEKIHIKSFFNFLFVSETKEGLRGVGGRGQDQKFGILRMILFCKKRTK